MNTRLVQREVAHDVGREVSFREGPIPAWANDFTQQGLQGGLTFTRASNAGYVNRNGVWTIAGSDVPRMDHHPVSLAPRGYLSEEARTNYLLNSATPVTQTVVLSAGTYTLSLSGTGSCACAAGTAVGNGFGTANAAGSVTFTLTSAGTVVFTVSGSVSRFQCENGTFATSFITTTTSAATRSADVCSVNLAGTINAAEGTFVIHCMLGQNGGVALGLDDGSGGPSNRGHITMRTNERSIFLLLGGTTKASFTDTQSAPAGLVTKLAFSYSAAGSVCAVNGVAIGSNTTAANGMSAGTVRVGCRYFPSATGQLNGWVQRVAYYPSALPVDKLIPLSI